MIDPAGLGAITIAFFVAAASPGPATLAVMTVAMSVGRRRGLMFAFGLSTGLAFWGLIAATGLGAILQTSSHALMMLKVMGGVYLLWLAWKSARSAVRPQTPSPEQQAGKRDFRRGVLLNLSNPKAVFAWMAVLAVGLGGDVASVGHIALATALCMVLGFLIYAVYAVIFSTSGAMLVYRSLRRWIDGVVAGLFALAGLGLIRAALVRQ